MGRSAGASEQLVQNPWSTESTELGVENPSPFNYLFMCEM